MQEVIAIFVVMMLIAACDYIYTRWKLKQRTVRRQLFEQHQNKQRGTLWNRAKRVINNKK